MYTRALAWSYYLVYFALVSLSKIEKKKKSLLKPTELHLKNTIEREHENDKILLHILLCLEFYSNEKWNKYKFWHNVKFFQMKYVD